MLICAAGDVHGALNRLYEDVLAFETALGVRFERRSARLGRRRGHRNLKMLRLVIISGGQTGVDRGALDAALEAQAPCGGWCPEGRLAEDGPIPERYPLQELAGAGYTRRTRQNVEDSDGTLILAFGPATGGMARTIEFCRQLEKPHLIVDASAMSVEDAEQVTRHFICAHAIGRLNVAGPRASAEGRGYDYARGLIERLLRAGES